MDTKQLFEKVAKGYIPIYPLASMQSIVDENQSINLVEVLNKYNHIYVTFQNNAKETRLIIPDFLRRYGLWISYEVDGSLYTEYFKGSNMDAQQEEHWSDDSYWEYVPDLQYIEDASRRIPAGAILPEHLSDSLQQLISQHHTITNMVDDEDLTTKDCGIIKFKDKKYEPNVASGKGYKILRKYFANKVNTLTKEDFEWQNTIYEVRYDYDLQEQTLVLPKGATLLFKGGSINNGVVQFDGGTIIGADKFEDCGNASFTGNWSKGLIMSFDDTPKWWNGTAWVAFASDSGEMSNFQAEVTSVETTDGQAEATVSLAGQKFSFTFTIPRGEQGPQGETGPAGADGKDGKDGKDGTIEAFNANAIASETETPQASVNIDGTTLNFNFGLVRGPKGEKGEDGRDGQNGADGKDAVIPNWKTYIYKQSEVKPSKPTSTDLVPSDWSDYPTSTGQWWQCIGTVNGTTNKVTEWSEVLPVNGQDGIAQDGKKTEFRFAVNSSSTVAPDLSRTIRNPSSWFIEPPVIGDGQYLWMTTATINPNDTLNGQWSIPVRISGEQGPQGPEGTPGVGGAKGQIVYPAGIYDVTKTYITDTNKAPYVLDKEDNNYYVLNRQMTWIGTEQSNLRPSNDTTGSWVEIEAFEAIFTKLGIIANGLIGSAVFNGDWMFSQQGTDSSEVFSDNYEDFDGNPVNGNFIPNIAINFKTGATYQRNSYIYGSVIKITKQITFTGNFTVTDIKNGSFYEINAQSAGAILLSRDNIENGCEIEFLITQWNSVIGENTVYISSKAKYTESSESGLVNSIGYEKSIDAVNTGVATITGGLLTVAHLKKSGAYAKFRYSDTLDTWCLIS